MNKLLTVLLAGFFAAGAAIAQTSGSGSLSGSVSGSASTNTNNNAAISANSNINTNTNTNTNSVNVYGPGSSKLARQAPSSGTNVSMMPGKGKQPLPGTSSNQPRTTTALNGANSSKSCPPGLAKKDNGCMPPGLARDRDDTRTMGNIGSTDRDSTHQHRVLRQRRHHH